MSSPRTETPVRPAAIPVATPASEAPKRPSLSAVQVVASALAAVSSAVVASFFGVAGTLIGAALASVIASVGTALYTASLRTTNERLQRLAGRPTDRTASVAVPPVLPAHLDPRRAPGKRSRPRWSRVAGYAVAVFLVAIGIVTGIELVAHEPVSTLVGTSSTSGTTTLGELTNASAHHDATPSTPTGPTSGAATAADTPAQSTATDSTGSGRSSAATVPSSTPAPSTAAPTGATAASSAPAESVAPTP